jgi:tellurite methyltransferase
MPLQECNSAFSMINDLRKRWDARWREKARQVDWQADPWLKRIMPLLDKGRVLDVACGVGRNALFLAEQHFDVTAVDLSPEALGQLTDEAARRGLAVRTSVIDLESAPILPEGPFDLVIDFFYLHRPLIPSLIDLLRPGGLLVLRTFSRAGEFPEAELDPRFALDPGELLVIFSGWEVLLHEEGLEPSSKGGGLAGIVARKPA